MTKRVGSRIGTIAGSLLIATVTVATAAGGPTFRWEELRDLDGRNDGVLDIARSGSRVAVLGSGEIHIPGPPRNFEPVLRVHKIGNGRLLWERVFSDESFERATDLATQGGRRIFVSGGDGFAVRAFASSTGHELWNTALPDEAAGTARDLASAGPLLYVAGDDGERVRLQALRSRTGRVAWERLVEPVDPGHAETARGIEVVGGRLFVLYHRGAPELFYGQWVVAALDASDGELLWRHELPTSEALGVLLAAGDRRAFVAFSRDRTPRRSPGGEALEVRALDAATGTLDWTFERDLDDDALRHGFQPEALVAAGPRVVLSGGQDSFHDEPPSFFVMAFSAAGGRLLWQDLVEDPDRDHGTAPHLAVHGRQVAVVATVGGSNPVTGEFEQETLARSYLAGSGRLRWSLREQAGVFSGFEGSRLLVHRRRLVVAGCRQRPRPDWCDIAVRGYDLR